ncbi:MAG: hypothetical protein FGM56_01445 [Limnohabitans sp.]|nr:hypothetical protein [Limnohabitans sp.]
MHRPALWKTLFTSLWMGACLSASVSAETRTLSCEVTYAGQTQLISVAPTRSPYDQAAVAISNRFRFKAVHVQGEDVTPRIGIYVYLETERQPLLIQHVLLQPPYPQAPMGSRVDLLGEQRLYAGPLERELIYRCFLGQGTP